MAAIRLRRGSRCVKVLEKEIPMNRRALFTLAAAGCILLASVMPGSAAAKKYIKMSDLTPAQRAKVMEQARQLCKKKVGPASSPYQVRLIKNQIVARCSAY
jgi:hypothetical protein